MARSELDEGSSYAASEKGVESGRERVVHQDIISSHHDSSGYDRAIVRVTELDDPEKQEAEKHLGLGVLRTVSTTRTTKDLEVVIGTPFEVKWSEGDPENPLNWTLAKRGYILVVVSMQTLVV